MLVLPLQLPVGPELLVLGLLWLLLPFVISYWIYTDGASRGQDDAAWWALAAGALLYLTFFGGFLALAVYVWQRE